MKVTGKVSLQPQNQQMNIFRTKSMPVHSHRYWVGDGNDDEASVEEEDLTEFTVGSLSHRMQARLMDWGSTNNNNNNNNKTSTHSHTDDEASQASSGTLTSILRSERKFSEDSDVSATPSTPIKYQRSRRRRTSIPRSRSFDETSANAILGAPSTPSRRSISRHSSSNHSQRRSTNSRSSRSRSSREMDETNSSARQRHRNRSSRKKTATTYSKKSSYSSGSHRPKELTHVESPRSRKSRSSRTSSNSNSSSSSKPTASSSGRQQHRPSSTSRRRSSSVGRPSRNTGSNTTSSSSHRERRASKTRSSAATATHKKKPIQREIALSSHGTTTTNKSRTQPDTSVPHKIMPQPTPTDEPQWLSGVFQPSSDVFYQFDSIDGTVHTAVSVL